MLGGQSLHSFCKVTQHCRFKERWDFGCKAIEYGFHRPYCLSQRDIVLVLTREQACHLHQSSFVFGRDVDGISDAHMQGEMECWINTPGATATQQDTRILQRLACTSIFVCRQKQIENWLDTFA